MELYKRHNEWINMARYLGGGEDDVQDMYILLLTMDKLDVNTSYIYLTLRSIIFRRKANDTRKGKPLPNKCLIPAASDDEYQSYEDRRYESLLMKQYESAEEESEYLEAEDIMYRKIDNILDSIHWYDAKLYKLYRDTGKSCRTLAKETGIGWMSIFNTIRNVKNIIREEVQEDYIDLKNRDYERIKEKTY
jgi:hypothetical protein